MLHRGTRRWADLTRTERQLIVAGAAVQLALQAAALWDMRRRRDEELRGARRWWAAASFLNFVGPITYFLAGRRSRGG